MERTNLVVAAALLVTLAPTARAGAIVFSDDFSTGASPAWGNERGSWGAAGGVYDAGAPNNLPPSYTSVTTFPALTDFEVSVGINTLTNGGVWLRSNFDGGDASGILFVNGAGGMAYWHTVVNDVYQPETPMVNHGLQGANVTVRLEVIGNTYSAYFNGSATPLTTYTPAMVFASGRVGLYDNSIQTFDDVVITDLTAVPEPGTLLVVVGGVGGALAFRRRRRGALRAEPSTRR